MSNWVDGIHIGIMTTGRFSIEEQFPDATTPPNVEISHLYGQVITALGEPAEGIVVRFNVACPPRFYTNEYNNIMGITTDFVDATTNAAGLFEIDLLKTVAYKIDIQDTGLYMAFIVPDGVDVINMFELLVP